LLCAASAGYSSSSTAADDRRRRCRGPRVASPSTPHRGGEDGPASGPGERLSDPVPARSWSFVPALPGRRGCDQFIPGSIAGHHLGTQHFPLVRRRVPGDPGALPIPSTYHVTIEFSGAVRTEPQVVTLGDESLTTHAFPSHWRMLVCHIPSSPHTVSRHGSGTGVPEPAGSVDTVMTVPMDLALACLHQQPTGHGGPATWGRRLQPATTGTAWGTSMGLRRAFRPPLPPSHASK
jgi:hypothetical protein